MISLLQAFILVSLIPLYELEVTISNRIKELSHIDEVLFEKNESLSPLCAAVLTGNTRLELLEKECLANLASPPTQAAIALAGAEIALEQEGLIEAMRLAVLSIDPAVTGQFFAPHRGLAKLCKLPGALHWKDSLIAKFTSESGGACNFESPQCHWEYRDAQVRPL